MYKKCFELHICQVSNPRLLGKCTLYTPHMAQEITYLCESPWIMKVKYEFHNCK
jgi:hypothetical protein